MTRRRRRSKSQMHLGAFRTNTRQAVPEEGVWRYMVGFVCTESEKRPSQLRVK